ncbi:hypothetical protein FA10DRAFT_296958 [Acaromyces ingoldii]|uniref:Uncharacterized protein n=1 Tax=Acaromyces ingoldii TaxID=215250 RepID=A0A316YFD0_9BASI|nr:hypothetical protein FA10DRAFT_296958 [Acaromyces ingoldii]PWN87328.1 hypothetical protein FA10DRAFT_296958 [Acaromyces ingoldii]
MSTVSVVVAAVDAGCEVLVCCCCSSVAGGAALVELDEAAVDEAVKRIHPCPPSQPDQEVAKKPKKAVPMALQAREKPKPAVAALSSSMSPWSQAWKPSLLFSRAAFDASSEHMSGESGRPKPSAGCKVDVERRQVEVKLDEVELEQDSLGEVAAQERERGHRRQQPAVLGGEVAEALLEGRDAQVDVVQRLDPRGCLGRVQICLHVLEHLGQSNEAEEQALGPRCHVAVATAVVVVVAATATVGSAAAAVEERMDILYARQRHVVAVRGNRGRALEDDGDGLVEAVECPKESDALGPAAGHAVELAGDVELEAGGQANGRVKGVEPLDALELAGPVDREQEQGLDEVQVEGAAIARRHARMDGLGGRVPALSLPGDELGLESERRAGGRGDHGMDEVARQV